MVKQRPQLSSFLSHLFRGAHHPLGVKIQLLPLPAPAVPALRSSCNGNDSITDNGAKTMPSITSRYISSAGGALGLED